MARAKKAGAVKEKVPVFKEIGEPDAGENSVLWSAVAELHPAMSPFIVAASKQGVIFTEEEGEDIGDYQVGEPLSDDDWNIWTPAATRALANALLFAADVAESGVRPTA